MKKMLSVFCCVLCIHTISQPPVDAINNSNKNTGEKVLMKAIAGLVNPEQNKKTPTKTKPTNWIESV